MTKCLSMYVVLMKCVDYNMLRSITDHTERVAIENISGTNS